MSSSSRPNLAEGFNRFFSIAPALLDSEKNDVYFIRHDVYARELAFEAVRPDQRETDAYDKHSVHCLMKTAESSPRLVGCFRLVFPDPASPDSLMPFEKTCAATLSRDVIDPAKLPRNRVAEISRLAVLSDFRRRKGEEQKAIVIDVRDFGDSQQPRFPYIPVGLYFASIVMAARNGIEHAFTLTEPRLAEHFGKLGVKIVPIGAPVEHRGTRVPSMIEVSKVAPSLRLMVRPLWKAIERQIDTAFANAGGAHEAAETQPGKATD